MATVTQLTVVQFTQKELQTALRKSCEKYGINDDAVVEFHITEGDAIMAKCDLISPTEAPEPVNNAQGH